MSDNEKLTATSDSYKLTATNSGYLVYCVERKMAFRFFCLNKALAFLAGEFTNETGANIEIPLIVYKEDNGQVFVWDDEYSPDKLRTLMPSELGDA